MQIVEEELATVDQARAYQIDDVLLVQLAGMKRTACHVVSIERSLLDVEPTTFVARLSMDIHVRCGPDPVPYEVHQAFRVGSAYGLQFHVEIDAAALEEASPYLPPDVVIDPVAASDVANCGRHVLRRWVDDLLGRPLTGWAER